MQTIYWNLQADNETEILKAAGCLLRQGEVVAFPTETVYGLGADGLLWLKFLQPKDARLTTL